MAFGEQSYTDDKLARALNISCTIIVSFEYVARVNWMSVKRGARVLKEFR